MEEAMKQQDYRRLEDQIIGRLDNKEKRYVKKFNEKVSKERNK